MAAEAARSSEQASASAPLLAATWLLVAVGVALLVVLSQQVERTPDELNYQLSGRRLVAGEPPDRLEDRFQGPLIFLGTQLTDPGGPMTAPGTLERARLGMLVFPALLLCVLAFWTRAAIGPRAGLLAAAVVVALLPTLGSARVEAFTSFRMKSSGDEGVRELVGAAIALAWMIALVWRRWRSGQGGR